MTQFIDSFEFLGKKIKQKIQQFNLDKPTEFEKAVVQAQQENGWFTRENIFKALQSIADNLTSDNLQKWIANYDVPVKEVKNVGLIMAGNIPLVGFHDFLSVLASGHRAFVKLSSSDKRLLPLLAQWLIEYNNVWQNHIIFTDKLTNIDAVIATGSNNSARYFEAYFSKYPHIIRKNRNSVAILSGNETQQELAKLGEDIFTYFGLGCRNVSKIYVPENYNFDNFFGAIYEPFKDIIYHHKYANNYDYNKAIHLLDRVPLLENGFVLLKQDISLHSPVAMLHYEYYTDADAVNNQLLMLNNQIQCIVADNHLIENALPFGKAQHPELWDYADNVDTLKFLQNIG
jgi:hypothetical protein